MSRDLREELEGALKQIDSLKDALDITNARMKLLRETNARLSSALAEAQLAAERNTRLSGKLSVRIHRQRLTIRALLQQLKDAGLRPARRPVGKATPADAAAAVTEAMTPLGTEEPDVVTEHAHHDHGHVRAE